MNSTVSRVEWRWVAVGAVIVMLMSCLPVVSGHLAETDAERFSGAVYDRQDYAVHLASMRLGAQGNWAYQLQFTTEDHPARFIKLGYLLLGKAASRLGLDFGLAFELLRFLAGLGLILALYRLISSLTDDVKVRAMAALLAVFASGLGWLQLLLKWLPDGSISPIDFWLIDAFAFFGMLTLPHFSLVLLLVMGVLIAGAAFLRRGGYGALFVVGISVVLIVTIQPLTVVIADLALLGLAIGFWRGTGRVAFGSARRLMLATSAQIPLLGYNYWALGSHPVWEAFAEQNVTQSPPPLYYLAGFGLLLPLAIWGAWVSWEKRNPVGIMFAFWGLCVSALLYVPLAFQRRFAIGLSIPVGVLAVYGFWFGLVPWLRRRADGRGSALWDFAYRRRWTLALTWSLFSSLSSLYLVFGGAMLVSLRPAELFDPRDVVQAADWLAGHAGSGESVFSSERTGLVIAPRSGLRVYIGHPIETVDYMAKRGIVQDFFSPQGMSAEAREQVLVGCGCDWLFVGPFEAAIGSLQAEDMGMLEIAYQNPTVRVYRVNR